MELLDLPQQSNRSEQLIPDKPLVEKPSHAASKSIPLGFANIIKIGRKPDGEAEGLPQNKATCIRGEWLSRQYDPEASITSRMARMGGSL